MTGLAEIQTYLRTQQIDGWLLYNFRELNPIAIAVAGLETGGSRRWFLWIPAQGPPVWLVQAIEGHMFINVRAELQGEMRKYVSWQEMQEQVAQLVKRPDHGQPDGRRQLTIAMEYSANNAIPFVSRIDAGIKELVEISTGATIISSADLAQLALAVLSDRQLASHRRAFDVCMAAKDAAFAYIGEKLRQGESITEYAIQELIVDRFRSAHMELESPIVAVNANAADPHYHPSAAHHRPIEVGDMVLIDLWSRELNHADDCYADLTWTGYCGSTVPSAVNEIFGIVAAGRDRAVAFINEKLAAGEQAFGFEVDDVCRQVITEAGYGAYFFHRTGHSLGPTDHYLGVNIDNLETKDQRALLPGLMFTIEPGIYIPDFDFDGSNRNKGLGIRSEINCYMHADRVEVTTLPLQTSVLTLL